MNTVRHDKLVRDRIPEIITAAGKTPVTEQIPDGEMLSALDAKLAEEVLEYQRSHSVEEIADVLEVLHGIVGRLGVQWEDIEAVRLRKCEERGGFEKGIRLIEVRSE